MSDESIAILIKKMEYYGWNRYSGMNFYSASDGYKCFTGWGEVYDFVRRLALNNA